MRSGGWSLTAPIRCSWCGSDRRGHGDRINNLGLVSICRWLVRRTISETIRGHGAHGSLLKGVLTCASCISSHIPALRETQRPN